MAICCSSGEHARRFDCRYQKTVTVAATSAYQPVASLDKQQALQARPHVPSVHQQAVPLLRGKFRLLQVRHQGYACMLRATTQDDAYKATTGQHSFASHPTCNALLPDPQRVQFMLHLLQRCNGVAT
jgi:hypothetical protein